MPSQALVLNAVSKKSTLKSGLNLTPEFQIELHSRDTLLLIKIQSFFGVGIIIERSRSRKNLNSSMVRYSVQSYRDLANAIIPHFDKFPLLTKKKADYIKEYNQILKESTRF